MQLCTRGTQNSVLRAGVVVVVVAAGVVVVVVAVHRYTSHMLGRLGICLNQHFSLVEN